MIRHIVVFKMKENALGTIGMENAKLLSERFKGISKKIEGVVSIETGFNFNSEKEFYEFGLNQVFKNKKALENYIEHPLHIKVRDFVREIINRRIVIDYKI